MLFQRRFFLVALFLAGTIVAGCSGGSTPAAPSVQPTTPPGSSITSLLAVPGTAGSLTLPSIGGNTPSFGIGAGAPAGLTLTATESLSAPLHAPVILASATRKTASASPSPVTPFLFITATFSASVPAGVVASEIIALSSTLPQLANYFCQIDDITGGTSDTLGTIGPILPLNGAATFGNGSGGAGQGLAAGHTYLFQFYELPIPAPTPTPTATATATATPSGTPTTIPSPVVSPTITPSPTPTGPTTPVPAFTFSGPHASSASANPPAAPAAMTLPATGGYGTFGAQATVTWGASSGSSAFVLSTALGTAGDISPVNPGDQFPFYTGSAATPLFYVLVSTSAPVSFTQSPAITVTVSHGFGSTNTCSLFIYANTGSGPFSWQLVPGAQANVAGNSVMIPAISLGGATASLAPGKTTLAFVGC